MISSTRSGRLLAGVLTASALALSLSATAADLPPVETILEGYAQAIGGEAVSRVKNMAAEFSFSMPSQGVYASGVEYWRAPAERYLRIDLAASGVADFETGVSGDLAWQIHPMNGTRTLKGDERRASLRGARINPFSDWKDFFERAETVGEEVVRQKGCYKVKFNAADGASVDSYFEKATGLLVREVVTASGGGVTTIDFADWEESQGILSPRSVRQSGLQPYTLKFTRVAYDVEEIPEGTFDAPPGLR